MRTLNAAQLKSKQHAGDDFQLVNTLSPKGFEQTHIPDSINIPLDEPDFPGRVEAIGGKDKSIVVYCASYDCHSSQKAAQELADAGFTDVMDFEGGAAEWQESGEHLVAESKS